MQCPLQNKETSAVLLDYCSRKTEPAATLLLERHIAGCEACRAYTESQKSVFNALDCWDDIEISPDFNRRLYARIDELESRSWWARLWNGGIGERLLHPFAWRPAMPIVTACLTLAIAFLLYTPAPKETVLDEKASQQVVKESVDLEQVEKTLDDIDMLRQLSAPSSGHATRM